MPAFTLIDIDFFYYRNKMIDVPETVYVPLGQKIIWRLIPERGRGLQRDMTLRVGLYFPFGSPFKADKQLFQSFTHVQPGIPLEVAQATTEEEGDFKYDVIIQGQTQTFFEYTEDPYIIVRRF